MQTKNVDLPIVVTGRHGDIPPEMREHAVHKIEGLHLDYPRIIEAKVILDVENYRQKAEVVLFCANHIVIEADTTSDDMKRSIDDTVQKIARRMRKYKTRLLKSHRARRENIRKVNEVVFEEEILDKNLISEDADHHDDLGVEPLVIHEDHFEIKPLYPEEAILELELSEKPFVLFTNENTGKSAIVYRRKCGTYGLMEP